jgi:competence protein ComEC
VYVWGANLAIVLSAMLALVTCIGGGRRTRAVVVALGVAAFVVVARPSPSVLRAAVMGAVSLLALLTGRPRAALPALAASVYALVLFTPQLSVSAGFALSVLATGAIIIVAPRWRDAFAARLPRRWAEVLAVALAAHLACAPLLAALFGQFSLVSVLANAAAEWAVPFATIAGALATVVAPVSHVAAVALAWVAWLPARWLVVVATVGSRLPGASIGWPSGVAGAAGCVAAIVVGRQLARTRGRRLAAAAGLVGLVSAGVLVTVLRPWPPPGWTMVACDVGQGDGLVVRADGASALVVDTGPDPAVMASCLRDLGVRDISAVVLTHMHADHIGGLAGVLGSWPVGGLFLSGYGDAGAVARVTDEARRASVDVTRVAPGDRFDVGALALSVLAPGHAFSGTRSDENNDSVVLRVVVGGRLTLLLTGDVEPEAQRALLQSGEDLRADVLKIPHHGSDHQDPDFLRATGARFAIASVGAGNPYGHPSQRTLATLQGVGMRTFRTDHDGAVAFQGTGAAFTAAGRRGSGTLGVAAGAVPAAAPPRALVTDDPECLTDPVAPGLPHGTPCAGDAPSLRTAAVAARAPPRDGGVPPPPGLQRPPSQVALSRRTVGHPRQRIVSGFRQLA